MSKLLAVWTYGRQTKSHKAILRGFKLNVRVRLDGKYSATATDGEIRLQNEKPLPTLFRAKRFIEDHVVKLRDSLSGPLRCSCTSDHDCSKISHTEA